MKLRAPKVGGFVLAVALVAGCASQAPKANAPHDVVKAMDSELAHTIEPADVTVPAVPVESISLPEHRMSLSQYKEETNARATWGVPAKTAAPAGEEQKP